MTLTRDRTYDAVERQVTAMGADVFEVGLFQPGATPEMIPRTWDKATLLRSVGWLKYQNMQGRNIFVRPKGEHPLSLIDDLTRDAVERMRCEGFPPCVVVETSPANFQAWVNHGRVLSKAESTAAARWLAERFGGDRSSADWRHFGRLAGFTNRKEKYAHANGALPYVRLIASDPDVRSVSSSMMQGVIAPMLRRTEPLVAGSLPDIDAFWQNPKYSGDLHRADLAFAIAAKAQCVPESVIAAALAFRDLKKKGSSPRQAAYVDRTIRKASSVCAGNARRPSAASDNTKGRPR